MHVTNDRLVPNRQVDQLREQLAAAQSELRLAQSQARMLRQEVDAARGARQRSSDILRDILYSSPVAIFLLDRNLQVVFISPLAESLFRVLSSELGRPFAELGLGSDDPTLEADIAAVVTGMAAERHGPVTMDGRRYARRVLPRRSRDIGIDGAVVCYSVSEPVESAAPIATPSQLGEMRHELAQPLQTLRLLHGVLRRRTSEPGDLALLNRLEEGAEALSGMVSSLFLEAELATGAVAVDAEQQVPVADILGPLRLEFGYHAAAKGVDCRIAASSAQVRTDPKLFSCLVRLLVLHGLREAGGGRLLVGFRRRGGSLRLEIWHSRPSGEVTPPGERSALPGLCDRLARMLGVEIRPGRHGGPSCTLVIAATAPSASAAAGIGARALPDAPREDGIVPRRRVCLIDDDENVLRSIQLALQSADLDTASFSSVAAFLDDFQTLKPDCLVVDVRMPEIDGLGLIERLHRDGCTVPFIMITGTGDVPMAVRAMRAGAVDFIEKPVSVERLLASIDRACTSGTASDEPAPTAVAKASFDLTPRQLEVMDMVVDGLPNKEIAARLDISQRTVENHRAAVMRRTGAKSLSDLIRMRLSHNGRPPAGD